MDIKQDPYIFGLQETHFRPRDIYQLKAMKAKGWKMIPMQMEIKRGQSGNSHFRYNTL